MVEGQADSNRITGALCHSCPLSGYTHNGPVLPESHNGDAILVIGDFPSDTDVTTGRPFSDRYGQILQEAFDKIGLPRGRVRLMNLAACHPPGGDMKKVTKLARRKDKALLHPYASCMGAASNDVKLFKYVIALGEACNYYSNGYTPDAVRGACEERNGQRVGYTLHPRRIAQDPKWKDVFHNDIAKAVRFFRNKLTWVEPEVRIITDMTSFLLYFPTWLMEDNPEYISYDVETDGLKPMTAALRCIGFASGQRAITVAVRSIDGHMLWPRQEWEEVVRPALRAFLKNPPAKLIGHNAGQYDRLNCEEQLGVTPKLDTDTILLSLLADNEMPHGLGYEGSYRTDFIEAWKADNTRSEAKTDLGLWEYNAKDCIVTTRIRAPLMAQVVSRSQGHLIDREHLLQKIGWGMTRIGLLVNEEEVYRHIDLQEKKRDTNALIMKGLTGGLFNPGSLPQLSRLLFGTWKLSPVSYSELTGEPSCDDGTIRTMITKYRLSKDQHQFLVALRMWRQAGKTLGTYLYHWLRNPPPGIQSHIGPDGRIHPSYNRLPATGRYSSSDPNAQNIPSSLRSCFIAAPGHIFVACDADALEAKAIAEESAAPRMLGIFNQGLDLHNESMELIYGQEIWSLLGSPVGLCPVCGALDGVPCTIPSGGAGLIHPERPIYRKKKGGKLFKDTRGVTKNVRYAWQYGAWYKKIWEQVVSVEDEHGNLPYAKYTKEMVREICDGLSAADPEVAVWWDKVEADWKRTGYVADTVWGRRRYFRGDATKNERINHPIQAGGFHIVMEAIIEVLMGAQPWFATESTALIDTSRFKPWVTWDFKKKRGMVTQTHDSSMWEVPEEEGADFAKELRAAMTRVRKVNPLLTYTAEEKIGPNWESV
jgi:DNA polymerase I-like protein with 3'-5' exonuclease and polymerase domains/uracil-DNA glycosylase